MRGTAEVYPSIAGIAVIEVPVWRTHNPQINRLLYLMEGVRRRPIIVRGHPNLPADIFADPHMREPEIRGHESFSLQPVGKARMLQFAPVVMAATIPREKPDEVHHAFLGPEFPCDVESPEPAPFPRAPVSVMIIVIAACLFIQGGGILGLILLLVENGHESLSPVDAEEAIGKNATVEIRLLRREPPSLPGAKAFKAVLHL